MGLLNLCQIAILGNIFLSDSMVSNNAHASLERLNMTKDEVDAFKGLYPEKHYIFLPNEKNPEEVIVELRTPVRDHSVAVALVEKSAPHFHTTITEVYCVEEGVIFLFVEGVGVVELQKGDVFVIKPNTIHHVEVEAGSSPARVKVISSPPWAACDHHLAK